MVIKSKKIYVKKETKHIVVTPEIHAFLASIKQKLRKQGYKVGSLDETIQYLISYYLQNSVKQSKTNKRALKLKAPDDDYLNNDEEDESDDDAYGY